MLKHSYSWDCRCGDCLGFEIGLRAEVQAEENRLKAERYSAIKVSSTLPSGQVIGQREMIPSAWNQTDNIDSMDSFASSTADGSLAALKR